MDKILQEKFEKYHISLNNIKSKYVFASAFPLQWSELTRIVQEKLQELGVEDAQVDYEIDSYENSLESLSLSVSVPRTETELWQEVQRIEQEQAHYAEFLKKLRYTQFSILKKEFEPDA